MSGELLIRNLTWIFYIAIFVVVGVHAIREPRRANTNIALFFGATAFIIAETVLADLGFLRPTPFTRALIVVVLLSLSYILLRLVDDFAVVSPFLLRASEAALVLLCASLFIYDPPRPGWLTALLVLFFVGLQIYAAVAFVRASRRSAGVTRRRMAAVALGSLFLALTILLPSLPILDGPLSVAGQVCGLLSGVSYFVGFAPPAVLRRAWQEPELRAFLGRAARLPRLPTTEAIVRELEQGAATSIGAPGASIGLWDAETNRLRFDVQGQQFEYGVAPTLPAGKTFLTQRPLFVGDMPREYPEYAEVSRVNGSTAMLMAPITAGENRLGILTVFAPRAPIFARDDLELVRLLGDQAAVILESRALIDEAARVRAREEATRMRDDFLSAAAHDLKTPLTTLISRAQLLERRAIRDPKAPADLHSIKAVVGEGERLRTLVLELLDASRAERGLIVGEREPVDLVALARATCERRATARHPGRVEAEAPVIGVYDPNRITQLLENLVENAIKYSPAGGEIVLKVWRDDDCARLTVSDQGIGVPPADLPHIFDRFYRAKNVNDRQFAGMGLGLFICRAIVEQHGGRIWATAAPERGTTFHVTLPTQMSGDADHA